MFERGDLVLIPFPFSDLSAAKKRPVLVLTRPDAYGDFIALAVTSRPQTDHGIALEPSDLVQGSLPLASWIRTDRAVTLNASLVVKSFGRASEPVVVTALARLCAYVGQGGPDAQLSSSS
ncbi:MAG: type II toxin-antitoxin system PemK/MazF family toxin [Magnetospirillum sp.]|nr:type II toxin-antitoxin system PemK/MazF family toxin [Magnetospirillum sp.]